MVQQSATGLALSTASAPLKATLEACPFQAGSLYTSYKDLALSVEWHDLRTLVLPGTEWAVILGHKNRQDPLRVVLPLPLHTTSLRPSVLKAVFASLATLPPSSIPSADEALVPSVEDVQLEMAHRRGEPNTAIPESVVGEKAESCEDVDRETLFLAITSSDSTVVYYKLTKGIKKPADIPDE